MYRRRVIRPLFSVSVLFAMLIDGAVISPPDTPASDPTCGRQCSCHTARNAVNAFCVIDKAPLNLSTLPGDLTDLIIQCDSTHLFEDSSLINAHSPRSVIHLAQLTSLEYHNCAPNNISSHVFSNRTKLSSFVVQRAMNGALDSTFTAITLSNIRKLHLSDTCVKFEDPNALCNYKKLQTVILSKSCSNTTVVNLLHCSNPFLNMTTLDLSYNDISVLPGDFSEKFPNLRYLSLRHNKIISLPELETLVYLTHLDLSVNNIKILPRMNFRNLLKELNISHNELIREQSFISAFIWLKKLTKLDFSFNRNDIQVSELWASIGLCCKGLQWLRLRSMNVTKLRISVLQRMRRLNYLDMGENLIERIYSWTFATLSDLTTLLLDNNRISQVFVNAFAKMKNLEYLSLKKNRLVRLDASSFKSFADSLKFVDMSSNYLMNMNPVIFLNRLIDGDFSNNYIKTIVIKNSGNLRKLSLQHNMVRNLANSDFYGCKDSIEYIILSNNKISSIGMTFVTLSVVKSVDLKYNEISRVLPNQLKTRNEKGALFFLSQNPIRCVCDTWLQGYRFSQSRDWIADYFNLTCTQPEHLNGVKISSLRDRNLVCNYSGKSHCRDLCSCCERSRDCSCRYVCPQNCTCSLSQFYHIVKCANRNLTTYPEGIAHDISKLDLHQNCLRYINVTTFAGYRQLTTLMLNNNEIAAIANYSFKNLLHLQTLHLENNRIETLYSKTFIGLQNLVELYLNNNAIRVLGKNSFLSLVNLKVLHLNWNNLKKIESLAEAGISKITGNIQITNNLFVCYCDKFIETRSIVSSLSQQMPNILNITCNIDKNHDVSSHALNEDISISEFLSEYKQVCENTTLISASPLNDLVVNNPNYKPFVAMSVSILCIVIIIILIYWYSLEIQLFAFVQCGVRIFSRQTNGDKQYDAFISYNSGDESYVVNTLAPGLERLGYSLCLHYRDFPVGSNISESIVSAVENSSCTLMLLSDNFLRSEWCRLEFQAAHYEVLKSRSKRLVIVLLEEVDLKKMDKTLKMYVKTNVYLRADDAWFWRKIEYAIPQKPKLEFLNIDSYLTNTVMSKGTGQRHGSMGKSTIYKNIILTEI